MLMPEEYDEEDYHHQGITRKGEPDPLPVEYAASQGKVFVNHDPAYPAAKESTEAVSHHHEQALAAGTYVRSTLGLNEEGTRDIEEIKGHTVNDA